MKELTHLSLFSGIGGLDLAAEWAGFRTVGQCEWADYPRAVLEKHWPGLPRWRDIRTLTKESFYEQTGLETVTVLSGGFPCQPFSTAGKRRGKEDDRYLWPEMLRVIQEIRPRWVIGENVAGIVSLALDTVLSDLENIGYACEAVIIPACAVDAPHRRDRCAILAYANSKGLQGRKQHGTFEPRGSKEPHRPTGECSTVMAYTKSGRKQRQVSGRCKTWGSCGCGRNVCNTTGTGLPDGSDFQMGGPEPNQQFERSDWWTAEPDVGRVAHGVPNRVDRLKCLGNAVVPQWACPLFEGIAKLEGAV